MLFASSSPLSRHRVRAQYLGERLDLRTFENVNRLGASPLIIGAGAHGCVVLLRYGAVVFFGVEPIEEIAFLSHLRPFVGDPLGAPEIDEVVICVDPNKSEGFENQTILLHEMSTERLQAVAEILGKSVALSYYESQVSQAFDRIEPLANNLEQNGKGLANGKQLLRHSGGALLIQHKMVGRIEVGEKPELLWERPELERLYARLEDEYELKERHLAMERKLELISRTVEILLELFQSNRSLRLEWYVVGLILLEILLSLYEIFIRQ
jgi:uncharacterized Rmd1/YagE family protein